MIVTIDGPAGSGKSTVARLLARRLGVAHLDTGAMYRAVTVAGLERGVDLADEAALARLAGEIRIELRERGDETWRQTAAAMAPVSPKGEELQVLVDGKDVTAAIRENRVSCEAHYAASNAGVRAVLVAAQQEIGRRWGSLVTEGRDQGSVVFPEAELKIYLDASEDVRAERRRKELAERGQAAALGQVREEIGRRDASDRGRGVGPLRVPEGAVVVDTSEMTVEQVVDLLAKLAGEAEKN
jgi:cytidylate kinase